MKMAYARKIHFTLGPRPFTCRFLRIDRKFKDRSNIMLSSMPASPRFRSLARISVIPLPGTFLHDSKRAGGTHKPISPP
jgi:hypothetical protein